MNQAETSSVNREKVNVFVYGTLKQDGRAYPLMQPGRIVMPIAKICGALYTQLGEHFPMALPPESDKSTILGEVHEIEHWMLGRVDRYEGHPHLFKRTKLDRVMDEKGNWIDMDVWAYMYNLNNSYSNTKELSNFVCIPSGVWSNK